MVVAVLAFASAGTTAAENISERFLNDRDYAVLILYAVAVYYANKKPLRGIK